MAGHYTERAALLELPASKKLVLMCVADSANWDNRVGFPGLPAIQQWSGLGRSRALEVVAELVTEGYLVRHKGGVNGRRAEFIVFPHGCCALHEPLPGYGPELPGHSDPGSGPPDPAEAAPPAKSQGPLEGPIEGPAQTGPLPSFESPVVTSGGISREQGSDDEPPSDSAAAAAPSTPPAVDAGPPARSCRRWPSPHGSCGACAADREIMAAWETAAHRDALDRAWAAGQEERARQLEARRLADAAVAACRLCTDAGVLPSGERCLHDPRLNPGKGRAEFQAALAVLPAPPAVRAAERKRQAG